MQPNEDLITVIYKDTKNNVKKSFVSLIKLEWIKKFMTKNNNQILKIRKATQREVKSLLNLITTPKKNNFDYTKERDIYGRFANLRLI